MTHKTRTRAQIRTEHTWDTASIFATPDDWVAAVTWLQSEVAEAAARNDRARGIFGMATAMLAFASCAS